MKTTTDRTVLTALLNYLDDIIDRVELISRLLTAMEQNRPEAEECWHISQDIVNDLMIESAEARYAIAQIDREEKIASTTKI